MQPRYIVTTDYMRGMQNDITTRMRGVLVDWLVEVAEEFAFSSETLFLCVNYVDRYPIPTILSLVPYVTRANMN